MFVSLGIRSVRASGSGALWHNGVSQSFYRVSKRCFFSGNGGSYNAGEGSAGGASSPFSYKTAVAYQPKDRDDPIYKRLKTKVQSPTGEDNYFVTLNAPGDVYAGVADGVGGWAEHGFDSSAISRELCQAMNDFSSVSFGKEGKDFTPKQLIEMGFNKINREGIVKVGGTTSIVAHFKPNGTLNVANLGDSWCGVFRESKLVFQTKFQTVSFNAPYQLAIIPEEMVNEARKKGGSFIQNKPADADEYSFELATDDIIVLATDGVTDNISYEDMELFLQDYRSQLSSDLQLVSQEFVKKVVKLSKDPNYPSVFAQELTKLTGKEYRGGKEDDITVVMVKAE